MAINYQTQAPGAKRTIIAATIAIDESVTEAINMEFTSMLGFVLPSAWTPAGVSLEVSVDGTNWATAGIQDPSGQSVGAWSVGSANTAYSVNLPAMVPWQYVRIRSGTFAAPVAQVAERTITVVLRPLA